jgi:hypothetical protein
MSTNRKNKNKGQPIGKKKNKGQPIGKKENNFKIWYVMIRMRLVIYYPHSSYIQATNLNGIGVNHLKP